MVEFYSRAMSVGLVAYKRLDAAAHIGSEKLICQEHRIIRAKMVKIIMISISVGSDRGDRRGYKPIMREGLPENDRHRSLSIRWKKPQISIL